LEKVTALLAAFLAAIAAFLEDRLNMFTSEEGILAILRTSFRDNLDVVIHHRLL
jgi:hypothetical protein